MCTEGNAPGSTCRYASLYFIAGIDTDENELLALEIIHRYVEVLDKWFMNVCELDIIFNFQQAYAIVGRMYTLRLDEIMLAGELQESSKRIVVQSLKTMEDFEKGEQASMPYF